MLGRHILVELFGCSVATLNDVIAIEKAMLQSAENAGATVLHSIFHHFSPYGVSGVVVIQESHLAIHTWPEFQYAAVDIFTCGQSVQPWVAYDFLKKALGAVYGSAMEINRGQTELLQRVNVEYLDRNRNDSNINAFKREAWFTDKNTDIALSLRHTGELLYRQKSDYQWVQVLNTYGYGKLLALDNLIMATEKDEFIYHEMLVHPALFTQPKVDKALVIGGGDGATARELLRHPQVAQVVVVEIDKMVVEAAQLHLPTMSYQLDNPKVSLQIADGMDYLANCADGGFDLILVDIASPVGPAKDFYSLDFYRHIYRCLSVDGGLVLQSESLYSNPETLIGIYKNLQTLFNKETIHIYLAHIPTYLSGTWSFIYVSKAGYNPLQDFQAEKAAAFCGCNDLGYYSADIHRAAFVLPPFLRLKLE